MSDDRVDAWGRLVEDGEALVHGARCSARVSAAPGSDANGSVRVALDAQGMVSSVAMMGSWRRLDAEKLAGAVIEAARDAAIRRLAVWGEAYAAGGGSGSPAAASGDGPSRGAGVADRVEFDREGFHRRLHAAATGAMSAEDRRAALLELLALAEAVEQGIDEVSARLAATVNATHTGHSPNRQVTVTVTGGGEVTAVRIHGSWLRGAHETNVGRQVTAAFRAAYENAAAHGVRRLIADSPLGQVQRATQDPLDLARRLRLTD
ncbi:YbaB/EbfC family nucleoid-associated protein [Paractinoplanes rishiriensis]|uniref:YbaB/EbfC DNA-binding family protein n=1 Tax=Paractinoplanes rishiriensis TaxID=1050105 RepID=A0A919N2S0_9ACTN|nr:YbaB/EbfC family nucleoid-associated protein [Actinoplanes rishiriensis]GIF01588.1 hypothetical protein Ari01nite_90520 [Actinoplanes rishiriensis]